MNVQVAVLLARLSNTLESARLDAVAIESNGCCGTPLSHIERAQKLVDQIRESM